MTVKQFSTFGPGLVQVPMENAWEGGGGIFRTQLATLKNEKYRDGVL